MDVRQFEIWKGLLFDPQEWVCGALDERGISVMMAERLDADSTFFSLNPLSPGKRRADENVTVFRNFLVEIDSIPLPQQRKAVADLDIPYSSLVYSGGKSLHAIVSLSDPCETEAEYRQFGLRFMAAVPIADPTTKNPSRLSRVPGSFRVDTRRVQGLLSLGARITRAQFDAWLISRGVTSVPVTKAAKVREMARANKEVAQQLGLKSLPLSGRTWRFLRYGSTSGKNHSEALQAAYDMAACGLPADEAEGFLETAPWASVEINEIANIIIHVYAQISGDK